MLANNAVITVTGKCPRLTITLIITLAKDSEDVMFFVAISLDGHLVVHNQGESPLWFRATARALNSHWLELRNIVNRQIILAHGYGGSAMGKKAGRIGFPYTVQKNALLALYHFRSVYELFISLFFEKY
jgi:hypothetical protein